MIAASFYPPFSRNFDDEQEYTDAAYSAVRKSSSPAPLLSPILRWKRGSSTSGSQGPGNPCSAVQTLVVAFSGGGASFIKKCFGLSEVHWVGTLVLPSGGRGPAGGDTLDASNPLNGTCNIFRKGDVAMALCGYTVSPAAAHSWARVLLDDIAAEVVVVLTSLARDLGRCDGWEGARLLATSAAEDREDCLEVGVGGGDYFME